MKHITKPISIALALIMLLSVFTALPITAGAVTTDVKSTSETSGDFEYEVLDDGTAEITGYSGDEEELEIPDILDGYTVTSIGYSAFSRCASLTNVTIPDSVKSIGQRAFEVCASLESVKIPQSVTSIGSSAFYFCTSLRNIEVDEKNMNYSSLDGNLYNKEKTELTQYAVAKEDTSFTVPNTVTSIGGYAFGGCLSLTSVTIGTNVTSIGDYAFSNCKNLTNVTIPEGVTSIGDYAFWYCTSLTSVTIPSSVTNIGIEFTFGYYSFYDTEYDELVYTRLKGFAINGYNGTEAEKYAKNNGFTFISLGDVPTTTEPSATEPSDKTPTPDKTTVTVKNAPKTLYVKGTAKINAVVENGKGTTTYKSSNTKVAKVDKNGKITALKKGTATITVTNNGASKSFKITVKNPKLNKTKKTLKKGKKFTLKITGGVGKAKFTSNNKKVAAVNKKGEITAKKKGKATITVKTNGINLKCKITVK